VRGEGESTVHPSTPYWSNAGIQYWSNAGQIMVEYWSNARAEGPGADGGIEASQALCPTSILPLPDFFPESPSRARTERLLRGPGPTPHKSGPSVVASAGESRETDRDSAATQFTKNCVASNMTEFCLSQTR
jgi:hypothetical protein